MKPLYHDVDVSTMYRMREEEGMSNAEIAEALGVSRETVWHYLGAGPRKKSYKKRKIPVNAAKPPEELFTSTQRETTLTGRQFVYVIRHEAQLLGLCGNALKADDLDALIEELQYIRRTYMKSKENSNARQVDL